MPISAQQWRVVTGSNNVRRPSQRDVNQFILKQLLFGQNEPFENCQFEKINSKGKSKVSQEELKDYKALSIDEFCGETTALVLMSVFLTCAQCLLLSHSLVTILLLLLAGDIETNPGPETPEYMAIKKCTDQLTSLLKYDLLSVSDYMWQNEMISSDVREKISHFRTPEHERATVLINYITTCVKHSTSYYHQFVSVLKGLGPWTNDMINTLERTYQSAKKSVAQASSKSKVQGVNDRIDDIAQQYGIDTGVLDCPCAESHLQPIAKEIVHWRAYASYLELTAQEAHFINVNPEHELSWAKPEMMLKCWQKKHKDRPKSHYRFLMKGFIYVEDNAQLVGTVCRIIAEVPARPVSPELQQSVQEVEEFGMICVLPESVLPKTQKPLKDVACAQVAFDKLWPPELRELCVYFINPKALDGLDVSITLIMEWAGRWENETSRGIVPTFIETKNVKDAHIRVKFETGFSWSKVGTDATLVENKHAPTMVLALRRSRTDFNRHTVIHEFGHALGLQHEHQRSKFWSIARNLIDQNKMRSDPCLTNCNLERDYLECVQDDNGSPEYDPKSIMHYWFDKKWLKDQNHQNLQLVYHLPDDIKKVILGIHERHKALAKAPSETDYKFLTKCYSNRKQGASNPVSNSAFVGGPTLSEQAASPQYQPGQRTDTRLIVPSSMTIKGGDVDRDQPMHMDTGLVPSELMEMDTVVAKNGDQPSGVVKIGVVGATSSGKSTTLNALMGGKFLPTSSQRTTAHVLCIKHDPSTPYGHGILVDMTQGPDKSLLLAHGKKAIFDKLKRLNKSQQAASNSSSPMKLELRVHIPFLSKQVFNIELYDTPGTSESKESRSYQAAKRIQDEMERLIFVVSVDTYQHDETSKLLERLRNRFSSLMSGGKVTVLLNKYDLLFQDEDAESVKETLKEIEDVVKISQDQIIFYSAKLALEARQWKANLDSVDSERFDDLKIAMKKIPEKKQEVNTLIAKQLSLKENVEHLSEIAEQGSRIQNVEYQIAEVLVPELT